MLCIENEQFVEQSEQYDSNTLAHPSFPKTEATVALVDKKPIFY